MIWETLDPIAQDIAHWAPATLPIYLLGLRFTRDKIGLAYWCMAVGFSVSAFADLATELFDLSWQVQPYYLPLQGALIAFALTVGKARAQDVIAITATFLLVMGVATSDGPDVWVRAVVSFTLCALAWHHRLAWPVFVYFGLGTAFYFGMLPHGTDVDAARPWWYGYQASRLTAFALFGRAAWRAGER